MTSIIIVAIISYLIGSIMFSVIFTKKIAGFDVRTRGSGNAGSTNVLRTAGKKVAIITLICDILKGVVAVLIGYIVGKLTKASVETSQMLILTAGVMVVLGHTFPIFFKFKGGKGVATSLGVLLMINWRIGLICLVFALLIMAVSRMVSLGSISAAILFPVLCIFINENYLIKANHFGYILFGIILCLLVLFNHRSNLKRIINGKENKLSFKK
jgi:glycerol-3-phosphate acyltransferase PlsY